MPVKSARRRATWLASGAGVDDRVDLPHCLSIELCGGRLRAHLFSRPSLRGWCRGGGRGPPRAMSRRKTGTPTGGAQASTSRLVVSSRAWSTTRGGAGGQLAHSVVGLLPPGGGWLSGRRLGVGGLLRGLDRDDGVRRRTRRAGVGGRRPEARRRKWLPQSGPRAKGETANGDGRRPGWWVVRSAGRAWEGLLLGELLLDSLFPSEISRWSRVDRVLWEYAVVGPSGWVGGPVGGWAGWGWCGVVRRRKRGACGRRRWRRPAGSR